MDEQQYISKGRPIKNAEPKNAPKERGGGQDIQFYDFAEPMIIGNSCLPFQNEQNMKELWPSVITRSS
jgi:hypothetical protein